MSDFFARFYPGDASAVGVAAVLLQINVVIALAAAAARVAKRRAALRHAVWLTALGCVLISPLLAVLAGRLGAGLVRIESPPARPPVVAEPMGPRRAVDPAPTGGAGRFTGRIAPERRNAQAACPGGCRAHGRFRTIGVDTGTDCLQNSRRGRASRSFGAPSAAP